MLTLPVNWCVLLCNVPKRVEPVTKSILEVIVCTIIVCAVRDSLLNDLLQVPVVAKANWKAAEKQQELDNNVQGILSLS